MSMIACLYLLQIYLFTFVQGTSRLRESKDESIWDWEIVVMKDRLESIVLLVAHVVFMPLKREHCAGNA